MEESDFIAKYWFTNTKVITVVNPREEDYVFKQMVELGINPLTGKPGSEQREYVVKAGKQERFPGPIANTYINQITKLIAQDEENISLWNDLAHRAAYFDRVIVGIDDLIATYQPNEAFMQKPASEQVAEAPKEEAFPEARKPGRPAKASTES